MKLVGLILGLFISQFALAAIVLQPGEARQIGGETVVCDGGSSSPKISYSCACFDSRGKNRGLVSLFATDIEDAVNQATPLCKETFRDWDLRAMAQGCFQQGR